MTSGLPSRWAWRAAMGCFAAVTLAGCNTTLNNSHCASHAIPVDRQWYSDEVCQQGSADNSVAIADRQAAGAHEAAALATSR